MKFETMRSRILSLPRRTPLVGIVTLTCIFAFSAFAAGAGNIFDDDWIPPKPAVQPHAAPAQPPPALPIPPAPATNPAAAPSPSPESAPQPESASKPPVRRPIPGKLEQARSRGLLKEALAAQLKDRSIAGRKKLAQALLNEVPKTADNPSDEYVLLGGAIEASKDAGVLDLCCQAADTMASQYEVDGLSIKTDAALKMNLRSDSPATAAGNVQASLALIDPLLAAEDFSTAARILTAARRVASTDPALASAVQKQLQVVESFRAAHDRVAASAEKLKTSPDDPAANLAVGSYLCFNRGEWEKGLVLLTRGSDANLKQLATLELSRPKTVDDVIRLADGWWEIATREPDAIRPAIRQHAAFFYKLALQSETGLRKTVLEHRIADAAADHAASIPTGTTLPGGSVNSIGMKFVRINPGIFTMGDGGEAHHVKIAKPYLMATTTVTQAQWKAVMGNNPSHFQGDDLPVECVLWSDAVAFCEKLSEKEGRKYRLPTEAEWEYACRAGTKTEYYTGDGEAALNEAGWYKNNSEGVVHPVGQKKPNPWGLYDMHGNVAQWCSDYHGDYPAGNVVDPTGPAVGDKYASRIHRGGSWGDFPARCRAVLRDWHGSDYRTSGIGFRVCLDF